MLNANRNDVNTFLSAPAARGPKTLATEFFGVANPTTEPRTNTTDPSANPVLDSTVNGTVSASLAAHFNGGKFVGLGALLVGLWLVQHHLALGLVVIAGGWLWTRSSS
jgi:hypothetical protein